MTSVLKGDPDPLVEAFVALPHSAAADGHSKLVLLQKPPESECFQGSAAHDTRLF